MIPSRLSHFVETFALFTHFILRSNSLVLDDTTRPPSKQAVIMHTGPSTAPASTINTLKSDGLQDIYITDIEDNASTDFNPYGAFPTDWTAFVSDVQC